MALTDLTGTTWTLNSSLTSYADGWPSTKKYSVNITTAEQLPDAYGDYHDSFVTLSTGYDGGNEYNRVTFSTSSNGYPPTNAASGNDTKTLPDTWNSRYEGTFTVTGGTDATNSTLIAWMEDNCTQYVPPTPPTPDVVVTYEDSNIVELFEAGTKTLKTAGKYLTDDVVLTYSGGGGGSSWTDISSLAWVQSTEGAATIRAKTDGFLVVFCAMVSGLDISDYPLTIFTPSGYEPAALSMAPFTVSDSAGLSPLGYATAVTEGAISVDITESEAYDPDTPITFTLIYPIA